MLATACKGRKRAILQSIISQLNWGGARHELRSMNLNHTNKTYRFDIEIIHIIARNECSRYAIKTIAKQHKGILLPQKNRPNNMQRAR